MKQLNPIYKTPVQTLENTQCKYDPAMSVTPNESFDIPINEAKRVDATPFHVVDPLNNYGGQKLP